MGCCFARARRRNSSSSSVSCSGSRLPKSRPLCKHQPKWRSDVPITEKQLLKKRDEFWDTAPYFEGRREIWDALRATVSALEAGDFTLAQAIIDGANIVLPIGSLTDCYDELGTRYQLPIYVLSAPVNLLTSQSRSATNGTSSNGESEAGTPVNRSQQGSLRSASRSGAKKPGKKQQDDNDQGRELVLRFRMSNTLQEYALRVFTRERVVEAKKRLNELHLEGRLPHTEQRWCYAGRMLSNKARIEDYAPQTDHVIQVIVKERPPAAVDPLTEVVAVNVTRGDASVRSHKSVRVHEPHLVVDPSLVQIEMRPLDVHTNETDSPQLGEQATTEATQVHSEKQHYRTLSSASEVERQGAIDANLDVETENALNLRNTGGAQRVIEALAAGSAILGDTSTT